MSTQFPGTALDTFTNPSSAQFLNSPSHSAQHDNINDAMAAVQAKIGINGSAVTTSLDYKLGGVTGSDKAASLTGSEVLTNKTLTTPIIAAIKVNAGANTATLFTSTDTVVGRATTDTLTNKTLTSPKVGTNVLDTNGNLLITVSATTSAVNGISIINSATGVDPQILPGGTDSARHLNIRGKGLAKTVTVGAGAAVIFPYDYVVSGCVWTADSVGVNLNASATAGVVVINGNPVTVASVTAHPVTLNLDTYIDILDNGDGTGLYVYTTAATNAASPVLASNSVRICIIQAAATITAATKVNQGQEDRVFPIASSIPYAVTDSLGNLICPRDPNRKVLGYHQRISNITSSGTGNTTIPELSVPVITPTGRKIKATFFVPNLVSGSANQPSLDIWSGAIGGTKIGNTLGINISSDGTGLTASAFVTPSSASTTFNASFSQPVSGAATAGAGSTNPMFLLVELN